MAQTLQRSASWIATLGAVALLLGLIWDARAHRVNPGLTNGEGPLSLGHPSHLLLGLGVTLCVIGALGFLWSRALHGRTSWPRRVGRLAPAVGLLGLALVALGAVLRESRHISGGHVSYQSALQLASPAQRAAADRLAADTRASAMRYRALERAVADGFVQTTPYRFGSWGPAHFNSQRNSQDGQTLDPRAPEGLVYYRSEAGGISLIGAMYLAPRGQAPAPGGPLTAWHSHPQLCVDRATGMVVPILFKLQCPGTATLIGDRVELLHVWFFEHPDGPFADGLTRPALDTLRRSGG